MSDLISRSTLLEELKEKVYPEKFGERCNALDVIYAVLQVINEQPVSYDVDKVVEQLEDLDIHFDNDYSSSNNEPMYLKEEVLDVVKGGGIE